MLMMNGCIGQSWRCADTLNGLILEGRMREIVVAG